jgi:hypothetical protein
MTEQIPKIDNAPGLTWRRRKCGWEARWQCRTDLAKRGYEIKSQRLGYFPDGTEPSADDIAYIQTRCETLQANMLIWGRGGLPQVMTFDGTIRGLIDAYQRDKDSSYRKLRYNTRLHYDTLCNRLITDLGGKVVSEITTRDLLSWHNKFVDANHIPMGHACVGMLRTILTFGKTVLADPACKLVRSDLEDLRFPMGKPRSSILTAEHVVLIRAEAHRRGKASIALAQAFQFDLMVRQKDVIGEWVPMSEPVLSDTIWGNAKWLRGIRWEEINENLILTHVTSKRQKEIRPDLRLAPMVLEEIDLLFPGWNRDRANLPANGPMVVCETLGVPWVANEFRRQWRFIATACGIPKSVRNMDSRAGAITEATEADVPLESIKHAATHSDIGMTQRYARGQDEKTADVMRARARYRENKSGT